MNAEGMNDHVVTEPDSGDPDKRQRSDLIIRIGREQLTIRQRYETLSIVNDMASGLMFVVGSVLFFKPATATAATWLFLIGSILMLFRPTIRLARRFHLKRISPSGSGGSHESSMDF